MKKSREVLQPPAAYGSAIRLPEFRAGLQEMDFQIQNEIDELLMNDPNPDTGFLIDVDHDKA